MIYELGDREYKFISQLVYEKSGINLSDGKRELIRSRLSKRLRTLEINSFKEYIEILKKDSGGLELTVLLNRLSTNKTDFFREPSHFTFLIDKGLTEICRLRKSQRDHKLRIWSAGCSSGQEPYTIAMVLLEHLPSAGEWDIQILASDLSTQVLGQAKNGVYPLTEVAEIKSSYKSKYFEKPDKITGQIQVSAELKKLITFCRLNLMEKWPMNGPFDLIFCRNVMIYFDKETQKSLIQRFYNLLTPGGYLFLGHSEGLSGITHNFKHVQSSVYGKPAVNIKEEQLHR